jgi:prevent-host-death family protein
MTTISAPIHEAKTKLTELIRQVEAGVRVVITRHGKPVAELGPPGAQEAGAKLGFFEAIAARQRARGLDPDLVVPVPDDFNDPLPEEFWLPPDHPLTSGSR